MERARITRAVRRLWWVLVLAFVVGAGNAYLIRSGGTDLYSSSTTLAVTARGDRATVLGSSDYVTVSINSLQQLVYGATFGHTVHQRLGLSGSYAYPELTASSGTTNNLLTVTATADRPDTARRAARTAAQLLQEKAPTVEAQISPPLLRVRVVEPATEPSGRSGIPAAGYALAGGLVGLALAGAAIVLIERLNRRLRYAEDARMLRYPPTMVAGLPTAAGRATRRDPDNPYWRALKEIVDETFFLGDTLPGAVLVAGLTNSEALDALAVATDVSAALSSAGKRCLVLDLASGDREPPSRSDLKTPNMTIESPQDAQDAQRPLQVYGDPRVLARRADFAAMLQRARGDHDTVLVLGPPALGGSDSLLFARGVQAAMVVARAGAPMDAVDRVGYALQRSGIGLSALLLLSRRGKVAMSGQNVIAANDQAFDGAANATIVG